MHVLIGEGRVDQDYIQRATLGFTALAQHVKQYDPDRVAAITGLAATDIVAFAHRYGATRASFLRVGIGLSRHDNGGMTCRTIACLPALTGAYAHPARRRPAVVERRVRPLQRGDRAAGPDAPARRRG